MLYYIVYCQLGSTQTNSVVFSDKSSLVASSMSFIGVSNEPHKRADSLRYNHMVIMNLYPVLVVHCKLTFYYSQKRFQRNLQ